MDTLLPHTMLITYKKDFRSANADGYLERRVTMYKKAIWCLRNFVICFAIVIFLITYGCATHLQTGKIQGYELQQILSAELNVPSSNIVGIEPERYFTTINREWVFDYLTGNPFYGDEPYTKKYISPEWADKLGVKAHTCGEFSKETDEYVEQVVPDAAFGIFSSKTTKEKLWGPFWKGHLKAHAMCWFITTDNELVIIEPQNPSEMKMAKNINRKIYYVAVGSQNPNKIMLAKDNKRELVD